MFQHFFMCKSSMRNTSSTFRKLKIDSYIIAEYTNNTRIFYVVSFISAILQQKNSEVNDVALKHCNKEDMLCLYEQKHFILLFCIEKTKQYLYVYCSIAQTYSLYHKKTKSTIKWTSTIKCKSKFDSFSFDIQKNQNLSRFPRGEVVLVLKYGPNYAPNIIMLLILIIIENSWRRVRKN